MKLTIKKIRVGELIFFLAYGLFLVSGILSTSYYYKYYAGTPYKLITVIVLLILIGKELYENRWTKRSIFTCAVSVGLFFLVNYIGAVSFAAMFILIWSARNIEFERIARFTLIVSCVLFVFIVLSSYAGIIENTVISRGARVRYYMGFRYALYGPAVLYNIISLYVYVRRRRIRIAELVILEVINYLVYIQTNSRLSFGLASLLLFVALLLKYFPNILEKRRMLCRLMIFSFPICAAISIGFTSIYDSSIPWMASLNTYLGSRLSLGKDAILELGYTMLGQKVSWHGWGLDVNGEVSELSIANYNYVDCGYLNVLLHYGTIVLVVCLIALTAAMLRCYRRKNYYLLILLTFVALHAVIDDLIVYLFYNTIWFAVLARIEGNVAVSEKADKKVSKNVRGKSKKLSAVLNNSG